MGNTAEDGNKRGASSSNAFAGALGNVKSIATTLGVTFGALKVADQIRDMTSQAIQFQSSMSNVATLLVGTNVSAKDLGHQILGLGGNLGSSAELADALYESLSAGVEPAKSVEFVATATKLAKAELFDAGNAAKLLATIMNAYGREVTDVNHVSDVFVKTINVGIVRGEELSGALGKVISTAAMAHVSIEEVAASVAIMTRAGINADEATTALNQALLTFISPSKEARKIAGELGIELSAATLQTRGFQGALELVKEATKGDIGVINELFGNVRAGKAVMALTGAQAKDFTNLIADMKNTVGDTDTAFKIQQENISNQWSAAFNNAQRILDKFAITHSGPLLSALQGVNSALESGSIPLNGFTVVLGVMGTTIAGLGLAALVTRLIEVNAALELPFLISSVRSLGDLRAAISLVAGASGLGALNQGVVAAVSSLSVLGTVGAVAATAGIAYLSAASSTRRSKARSCAARWIPLRTS
jgi:TP901 family phage tail tape measure protein